jgi:5-methylcytosine-specific restriction endonuclease McrA
MPKGKLSNKVRCYYCGTILGKSNTTTDHVVPLSKGGSNKDSNLVTACLNCNHDKNGLSIQEWRVVMAFRKGLLPEVTMRFYGEQ